MRSIYDVNYITQTFIIDSYVLILINFIEKVHESHECAYFPYGGQERKMHHYEVLVLIKWLQKRKGKEKNTDNTQTTIIINWILFSLLE